MDSRFLMLVTKKMNKCCGLSNDNLIYSLIPAIEQKKSSVWDLYRYSLDKLPLIIDCGIQTFTNKKINIPKNFLLYRIIKREKETIFHTLTESKDFLGIKEIKISSDRISSALALISSIYANTFLTPTQFFLPHSSVCSGQWDFWDKIDYLELTKKMHQKETAKLLIKKLMKSDVWNTKFQPNDFPEIVKRRLTKEKLLEKKLSPEAMIKAIIIRMGELAAPSINYEVIDFSIRSFFTYLGVKQYLRVDREILFLRRFEKETKKILAGI